METNEMTTLGVVRNVMLVLVLRMALPATLVVSQQGEQQIHPGKEQSQQDNRRPSQPNERAQQEQSNKAQRQTTPQQQQPDRNSQQHRQQQQPERPGFQYGRGRQDVMEGNHGRASQHRQAERREENQRRAQHGAWQQRRAQNWQLDHRSWNQRGGYRGYRIPDNRFRKLFGPRHAFRIFSLPILDVGEYPRFQYGGYWFTPVDPWPEYWSDNWYETDDVYIVYSDDGYYLFNPRYPGVGIAVSISM
jgi:hypothetical protein